MTDPMTPEQLERIARLQARRSASSGEPYPARPDRATARTMTAHATSDPIPTSRKRRRHPALGSRIAAAGLGATSMLAIVGLFGLRDRAAQDANTVPVPAPPQTPEVVVPPVQVVVHRVPASANTIASAEPASTVPSAPIELTANTIVRTVTVTEAPRRRSSSGGSSGGGGGGGGATPAPAPQPASNASSGGSK